MGSSYLVMEIKDRDLIRRIKGLRKVEPSGEWVDLARRDLMAKIGFDEPVGFFEWIKQTQSMALAACLVLIFIGGPWITLKAAQMSLPGELLYSVKRAGESVQSAALLGGEKSQLQADFACRRLEELTKITKNSLVSGESDAKARKVVVDFKGNLANFSQDIDKISKEEAVAVVIRTKQIKEDLDKVKENASSDIKNELVEADETIKDIGQQILAVLLVDGEEGMGTTTPGYEILTFLRELETGGTTTTEEVINVCE